jgi:DedD protein
MEERTRHRAVGAAVLLLAAVIVLPLVLESSPPDERSASEPAPADPPDASPDRIRITTFDGHEEDTRPSKRRKEAELPAGVAGLDRDEAAPFAGWAVQIGSFAKPSNAESLRKQLAARGYRVLTEGVTTGEGKPRVRVLVGPDRTRHAAAAQLRLLREDSIQGFLVRYPG